MEYTSHETRGRYAGYSCCLDVREIGLISEPPVSNRDGSPVTPKSKTPESVDGRCSDRNSRKTMGIMRMS